jgi:hypothetical protein
MNKFVCVLFLDLTLTCATPLVTAPLRKDIPFLPRQECFTRNVSKLINFINSNGYQCTIGETFRSKEGASIMNKQGKGIADSNHCYRMAIDLNIFKEGKYLSKTEEYKFAGVYWESLNRANEWGGRWKRADGNHFEMD